MVKRENLLLIAGLFWIVAGLNVVLVGVQSFLQVDGESRWWMFIPMVVVFAIFAMMFRNVARKHANRILSYEAPKLPIWRTFDVKGYLIIVVMMGGGMALRFFHLVPTEFVGFFYPGLGSALAMTGILLVRRWGKAEHEG